MHPPRLGGGGGGPQLQSRAAAAYGPGQGVGAQLPDHHLRRGNIIGRFRDRPEDLEDDPRGLQGQDAAVHCAPAENHYQLRSHLRHGCGLDYEVGFATPGLRPRGHL